MTTVDIRGAQIICAANYRDTLNNIDLRATKRIASQLVNGGHTTKYGVDSARKIVVENAKRVSAAIVVRPSARVQKGVKCNDTYTRKLQTAANAVDKGTELADSLKRAMHSLECAKASLAKASSRAEKRHLKSKIFSLEREIKSL